MKTMNLQLKKAAIVLIILALCSSMGAQTRHKIGVISMDTKGLQVDNQTLTSLVHLELEKVNVFEVMDRYDLSDQVNREGINVNECFGKTCLVRIGSLLGADKMLSGSAERFGNKIVFIFRLIDVKSDKIEKTDVMEFIDQQDQLQVMVRMCINNIIGVENDKFLVDLLVNYDQPITTSRTTLNLNGPRVGFTYAFGEVSDRLTGPKSDGGFDMFPVSSSIGYQFEKRFLSSGDFQALFEFIPSINGLESGMLIPSITTLLGFRFNQSGIEFGLGPVIRTNKSAKGFYDETGKWRLKKDVNPDLYGQVNFEDRIDSRGNYMVSTGMIFAIGKTFRSGYLNMPINLYVSPQKKGSIVGINVGFNVSRSPLVTKK